jgi:hypothetical protein
MAQWTSDDVRLIVDGLAVATGALLIRGLTMLVIETYVKPALIWLGEHGYKKADKLTGDRLPDFFPPEKTDEQN